MSENKVQEPLRELGSWNATVLLRDLWADKDWEHDEHLKDTPTRFVKMMKELTTPEPIRWTTFTGTGDEMVVQTGITFTSLCAHHLVPYIGVAHVAYVPKRTICGLSKLARVVRHFAADLTIQEELTTKIAAYLNKGLIEPLGVGVVMQAEHLCMNIRGVKAPGAKTTTSCMKGVFADHTRLARAEFLQLIEKA